MTRIIELEPDAEITVPALRELNNRDGEGGYCIMHFDLSLLDKIKQLSGFVPSDIYVGDQHLHEQEIGHCQAFHFVPRHIAISSDQIEGEVK
jgi:hypothetical protein